MSIMMTEEQIAHPPIVSQEEWLAERKKLLIHEKELTKHHDRVAAERRRLPMVKVDKNYVFEGPEGKISLKDLFEGRPQLIVYHFMFDPEWEKGCPGCTGYVDEIGDLTTVNERNTTFVLISRAPYAKLAAYKADRGWTIPWFSSFGTDFNYDYHVTLDESVAPIEYNYKDKAELRQKNPDDMLKGEATGISVFFLVGDDVFHTYTAYARGTEGYIGTYSLLEATPYGRQEDWEDSPSGWPQKPTYS